MPEPAQEVVPGMADAIEERRRELRLTKGDFATATGLTRQGLNPVRKGLLRQYNDRTIMGVADALRWETDWYDRLRRGEQPQPVDDRTGAETLQRDGRAPVEQLEVAVVEALADMGIAVERSTGPAGPDITVTRSDGPPVWIEVRSHKHPRAPEHAMGEMLLWAHRQPIDRQPILVLAMLGEVDSDRASFADSANIELVGAGSVGGVVEALTDRLVRLGAIPEHALAADADTVTGDASRSPTTGPSPEPNE